MTFYDVIEKILDTRDTTVGGGSASAVSAAMAAGLVGMVARLSVGKNFGLADGRYLEIAAELEKCSAKLKDGAVADTQSFLGIKAAFGLPKASEEEKVARRAAIEAAAVQAASVPLENGHMALHILELCEEMKDRFNSAATSDMEAGIMLARMAVVDTALNIEANLSLIKSPDKNAEFACRAKELKDSVR